MAAPVPRHGERWVCPRCTGVGGVHYLTCPTLRLPADTPLWGEEDTP